MSEHTLIILESLWGKFIAFSKKYPRLTYLLEIAIIFGLFFIVTYGQLDPDFGWHLSAGNYIIAHGVPAHDIYTYTARSFRWIDHEWGNDVITSVLFQVGGYLLTSIFFAALWTVALFTNRGKIPFIVIWLGTIATIPYAGIRPTIWTVLGIAILIKLSSERYRKWRPFIPLMFLIWANLHAGFVMGFVYLGFMMIKEKKLSWGLILLGSFALSFVNPYGPRLYVEIIRTFTDSKLHSQIKEWAPFYVPLTSLAYIVLWGVGFMTYFKKRLKNLMSFSLLMLLATLSASRNLPLFVVASLQDIGHYFTTTKHLMPRKSDSFRRSLVILFFYFLASFCVTFSVLTYFKRAKIADNYPIQAVAYLQTHACPGNLFNSYNYGGYLIWKLPSEPVYIDGRMPTWKDGNGQEYLDRYFDIFNNSVDRQKEFARYNIQCVLVSNSGDVTNFITQLQNSGWQNVLDANNSILLINKAKS